MLISIHQPNYHPYLGFFDKMEKSDIFIILDDAQFSKGDYHNRNRILTKDGVKWLTIPFQKGFIPINEVEINNDKLISGMKWNEYHIDLIKNSYKPSVNYNDLIEKVERIYQQHYDKIIDINLNIIKLIAELLKINTKVYLSSELNLKSKSTQKLVDICNYYNCKCYLSGKSGPDYMDMELFKKNNIEVLVQDYHHPVYKQTLDGFYPNLSSLDYLFNKNFIINEK